MFVVVVVVVVRLDVRVAHHEGTVPVCGVCVCERAREVHHWGGKYSLRYSHTQQSDCGQLQ